MIDMRWNSSDTFETVCRNAPFSELVRIVLLAGVALRDRIGGGLGHENFGGFAGHAAS